MSFAVTLHAHGDKRLHQSHRFYAGLWHHACAAVVRMVTHQPSQGTGGRPCHSPTAGPLGALFAQQRLRRHHLRSLYACCFRLRRRSPGAGLFLMGPAAL